MKCMRSRTGLPVISENGGGMSNTGQCQIISDSNGLPLTPLFVPRGYSNQDHAFFVAKVGMFILFGRRGKWGESIVAERIVKIGSDEDPDIIITEKTFQYENGDGNFPEWMMDAFNATKRKMYHYHCRTPFFIK